MPQCHCCPQPKCIHHICTGENEQKYFETESNLPSLFLRSCRYRCTPLCLVHSFMFYKQSNFEYKTLLFTLKNLFNQEIVCVCDSHCSVRTLRLKCVSTHSFLTRLYSQGWKRSHHFQVHHSRYFEILWWRTFGLEVRTFPSCRRILPPLASLETFLLLCQGTQWSQWPGSQVGSLHFYSVCLLLQSLQCHPWALKQTICRACPLNLPPFPGYSVEPCSAPRLPPFGGPSQTLLLADSQGQYLEIMSTWDSHWPH